MENVLGCSGGKTMKKDAVIDPTGLYRYWLYREWDTTAKKVAFVMLNPSCADTTNDDPTLRRCISFAKSWGYGSLEVVNLFAYRDSKPVKLKDATDPVGKENDRYLQEVVKRADKIIVAWGNSGILNNRYKDVLNMLNGLGGIQLYCLKTTKKGHPYHPLYVKGNTKPVKY